MFNMAEIDILPWVLPILSFLSPEDLRIEHQLKTGQERMQMQPSELTKHFNVIITDYFRRCINQFHLLFLIFCQIQFNQIHL